MAKFTVTYDSILGGHTPVEFAPEKSKYTFGFSIDPEFPLSGLVRTSGSIVGVKYSKFSSTPVNAAPVAVLTTPKDTNIYTVLTNGKIVSYSSLFGTETTVGTCAGSTAAGATYYNNYIYIFGTGASTNDISRYGPLDGTPALVDGVWTGATLGSQTALTNTTYPTGGASLYPNHWGHVHSDNKLYFTDFKNGRGMVHCIKTTKTTAEGDTNDGSAYQVLTLPINMRPSDIETYGLDIAVTAFQTTNSILNQGRSAMYLWDTTSGNFYREVPIVAPMASAVINKKGELYVFAGDLTRGYSLLRYLGGYSFESLYTSNTGWTPYASGVDIDGNRLVWGSATVDAPFGAGVFALGYRDQRLPGNAVNQVANYTGAGDANATPTCVRQIQQNSGKNPQYVIGWRDGSAYGLDKLDGTQSGGTFYGRQIIVGQRFKINKIRLPLSSAVAAGTSFTVNVLTDGTGSAGTARTINNTNDAGKKNIIIAPATVGENSFMLQIVYSNTTFGPHVMLPITIEGETLGD